MHGEVDFSVPLRGLFASAPFWVFLVIAAYVAGRRKQFSLAELLALVTAEAIVIAITYPSWIRAR